MGADAGPDARRPRGDTGGGRPADPGRRGGWPMMATLARSIDRFASRRVLVLGDAMLDSYVVGSSTRLCQEAPVPVVDVRERRDCPGGAANTAVNLAALGCTVGLVSAIG